MYGREEKMAEIRRASNECCETAPRDVREVGRAMADLYHVIDRYENLVHRLSDRLNSVVSSAPPSCEDGAKEPGYCTGLASSIDDCRRKLRDITNILESLYERIEL
jgi:hypothetical protein